MSTGSNDNDVNYFSIVQPYYKYIYNGIVQTGPGMFGPDVTLILDDEYIRTTEELKIPPLGTYSYPYD